MPFGGMQKTKALVVVGTAGLALAGCSGGGSGSPGPGVTALVTPNGPARLSPNTSATVGGVTTHIVASNGFTFSREIGNGSLTISPTGATNGSGQTPSRTSMTGPIPVSNLTGTTYQSTTQPADLSTAAAADCAGNGTCSGEVYATNILVGALGTPTLAYSYGGRVDTYSGTTLSGRKDWFDFFGGQATTDMPTQGTATYAGRFTGDRVLDTAGALTGTTVSGAVSVNADFASRSVTGSVTGISTYANAQNGIVNPVTSDLAFSGTISGSTYTGTAGFVGGTANGVVAGGFYGPAAAETAGALSVTRVTGNLQESVSGWYGAKK